MKANYMMRPAISIVMPVYNEEKYIENTIRSILNQSYTNFEFIIVDDGSTDGTQDKLKCFADQDKRIIIIAQDHLGIAISRNNGMNSANGKYIAVIDGGDLAHPSRIKTQYEFLEENGNISIVGTWAYIINEEGEIIGEWKTPRVVDKVNLYHTGGAIHPTIMVRSELFSQVGAYKMHPIGEDRDFYFRAAKSGAKIANLPEFLTSVMKRDMGQIRTSIRKGHFCIFKVKMRYLPHFFCLRNVISTAISFCGYLLPSFLLRRLQVPLLERRSLG